MIKLSLPRPLNWISVLFISLYAFLAAGFPTEITDFICSAGLRRVFCELFTASNATMLVPFIVNDPTWASASTWINLRFLVSYNQASLALTRLAGLTDVNLSSGKSLRYLNLADNF